MPLFVNLLRVGRSATLIYNNNFIDEYSHVKHISTHSLIRDKMITGNDTREYISKIQEDFSIRTIID